MLSHHMRGSRTRGILNSQRRDCIQITSAVALARLLYLDSVLERQTVCCFLEDQATALQPKKMQYPVMLQRSSGSLPQSASHKCHSFLSGFPGLAYRECNSFFTRSSGFLMTSSSRLSGSRLRCRQFKNGFVSPLWVWQPFRCRILLRTSIPRVPPWGELIAFVRTPLYDVRSIWNREGGDKIC